MLTVEWTDANVQGSVWTHAHLCHRWSVQPTGSWMQTIRWPRTPTLRSRLRQKWKWSTRPSTCHTPATPLLHAHLSLPLSPTLPLCLPVFLSLPLATFCYAVEKWQPPPPAVILLLCLLSSVWLCGFLTADCLVCFSPNFVFSLFLREKKQGGWSYQSELIQFHIVSH